MLWYVCKKCEGRFQVYGSKLNKEVGKCPYCESMETSFIHLSVNRPLNYKDMKGWNKVHVRKRSYKGAD